MGYPEEQHGLRGGPHISVMTKDYYFHLNRNDYVSNNQLNREKFELDLAEIKKKVGPDFLIFESEKMFPNHGVITGVYKKGKKITDLNVSDVKPLINKLLKFADENLERMVSTYILESNVKV